MIMAKHEKQDIEKEKLKLYRLKQSWKNNILIILVLGLVIVSSYFIGFYLSYDYIDNQMQQSYNNIIYAYNDKVNYIESNINSTQNTQRWKQNIKVTINSDTLIIDSNLKPDEIITIANDIENELKILHENAPFKQFKIIALKDYNTRTAYSKDLYNTNIANYKNIIASKYAYVFQKVGKQFKFANEINIELYNFD